MKPHLLCKCGCVRAAWEQGWRGGLRTLHNGYSELQKVALSQFSSHLQRAVISALLLEHRAPFDKSLCTGTAALFPHERNKFFFFFFSIIFAVHWVGRASFSLLVESCCAPSGSGTGRAALALQALNSATQPPVVLSLMCFDVTAEPALRNPPALIFIAL